MFYFLKMYTNGICLFRLSLMIGKACNLTDLNHKYRRALVTSLYVFDHNTLPLISTSFSSIGSYINITMIDIVVEMTQFEV